MILNSLCVITGLIGFLITAILIANKKSNPIVNSYLVLLIFIISLRFFNYGLLSSLSDQSYLSSYSKYSNLTAIIIPICYLYFKHLAAKSYFHPKDLLHFVFPVTYFVVTYEIHQLLQPNFITKCFIHIVFIGFLSSYIYLSIKTLKTNIWNKKSNSKSLKKQNQKVYHWTLFLFIGLLLSAARLSISLYIEMYNNGATTGFSYQWVSALIWMIILVKILVTPEILYGYQLLDEKLKENRNSNLAFSKIWNINPIAEINNKQHLILKEKITPNVQDYFEIIEKVSTQNNIFRETNMTLTDFANKLNIPKSHLSYLFKYHSNLSFSEYKKVIRIQDAIKLIEQGYLKSNTMDSLSKEIGFTSYNPFFTSFKNVMGIAPLEYINQTIYTNNLYTTV